MNPDENGNLFCANKIAIPCLQKVNVPNFCPNKGLQVTQWNIQFLFNHQPPGPPPGRMRWHLSQLFHDGLKGFTAHGGEDPLLKDGHACHVQKQRLKRFHNSKSWLHFIVFKSYVYTGSKINISNQIQGSRSDMFFVYVLLLKICCLFNFQIINSYPSFTVDMFSILVQLM